MLAAPLAAGGRVACTSPFSVAEFHRGLEAFRPTWTQCAPAMLQELVLTAGEHAAAIARHRMRFLRSVSAALPADMLERVESTFGAPVIEIYGMTETAGVITSNPLPPRPRKPGSVGVAAGPEVAIVDDGGARLPAGSRGEVVVRGDNVMAGYAGGEDANAAAWFGPWLRTGDEGRLDDDGYLFLTGRIKEIVNRGGEKVSPFEVDDVLRAHPAVLEAATFALPHPTLGEEVAAAVVLRPGASVEPQALVDHVRGRLAWFKVPRVLRVVPAIPKTAAGKLRRRELPALLGIGARRRGRRARALRRAVDAGGAHARAPVGGDARRRADRRRRRLLRARRRFAQGGELRQPDRGRLRRRRLRHVAVRRADPRELRRLARVAAAGARRSPERAEARDAAVRAAHRRVRRRTRAARRAARARRRATCA